MLSEYEDRHARTSESSPFGRQKNPQGCEPLEGDSLPAHDPRSMQMEGHNAMSQHLRPTCPCERDHSLPSWTRLKLWVFFEYSIYILGSTNTIKSLRIIHSRIVLAPHPSNVKQLLQTIITCLIRNCPPSSFRCLAMRESKHFLPSSVSCKRGRVAWILNGTVGKMRVWDVCNGLGVRPAVGDVHEWKEWF